MQQATLSRPTAQLTPGIQVWEEQFGPNWKVQMTDLSVRIEPRTLYTIQTELDGLVRTAAKMYKADYAATPNASMLRWGIPAPIIRLDMAPDGRGIYEVEANPAGMGIAERRGIDLATPLATTLRKLGVTQVTWGAAPSRQDQAEDLKIFMEALDRKGIETRHIGFVSTDTIHPRETLWLRAGEEDLKEIGPFIGQCLLLHRHGGGHKGYLVQGGSSNNRARPLKQYCRSGDEFDFESLFEQHPYGFALKPKESWGSQDIHFWCPMPPYKDEALTRTAVTKVIPRIIQSGQPYLVQPFAAPDVFAGRFWIWRVYAVYDPDANGGKGQYRLVGGFLAGRRSLKIHGAGDTWNGIVTV